MVGEVETQNVIVVLAPFAVMEPFNVALVAATDVAALVVAVGTPTFTVKVKVFVAVWGVGVKLSVTEKVKLRAVAVSVGVPDITPVVVLKVKPAGKVPLVIAQLE